MRRSQTQSTRNPRPSAIALSADDLGILREGEESNEDVLRRQLLERDRLNDKLQTQVQTLQALLAARPPLEKVEELEREFKNLELLLQGTQRENERCMAELERGKTREKMLENALAKGLGEDWQSSFDFSVSNVTTRSHRNNSSHMGSASLATPMIPTVHSNLAIADLETNNVSASEQQARLDQIRMLILGMEQRLQTREDNLNQKVEKAQGEAQKFEQLRAELISSTS